MSVAIYIEYIYNYIYTPGSIISSCTFWDSVPIGSLQWSSSCLACVRMSLVYMCVCVLLRLQMDLYSIYLYLSSSQVWWGDTPRVNESNESAFMLVAISTKLHCVFDGVDANFMMKSAIFAPYHGKILPHIAMVLLYAAVRIWSCFFTKASSEFTCIARIGRLASHGTSLVEVSSGTGQTQRERTWLCRTPAILKPSSLFSISFHGQKSFKERKMLKASREIPWGIREIIHSYIIYHSYMSF